MSAKMLEIMGKAKGKGIGSAFGIGINTYFAKSTYDTSREEGNGVIGSLAYAAGDLALMSLTGWKSYLGLQLMAGLPGAIVDGASQYNQYGRKQQRQSNQIPFQNATFVDTQQTYTMRQAGMALAKQSKYNMQQTLMGNEARYLHR